MRIEDKPEFSIVLAVHNLENYVTDAIMSVIKSDFNNWELIIVDDGSEDNTHKVCQQFTDDSRIKLLSTHHQGLGSARNIGMSYTTGNYILFLDGDDYYSKTLMSDLHLVIANNDTDVILFAWQEMSTNGEVVTAPARFREKGMTMAVWNKCVSRSLIMEHQLQFQEGVLFEDVTFTFELSMLAKRFMLLDKIGYYYRIRENSISTMPMTIELRSDIVKVLNFLKRKIEYRGLEVEEFVKICVLDSCLWHVKAILKHNLSKKAKILLNDLFATMAEFGCDFSEHGKSYGLKTKIEMYLIKNKLFSLCRMLRKLDCIINRHYISVSRLHEVTGKHRVKL